MEQQPIYDFLEKKKSDAIKRASWPDLLAALVAIRGHTDPEPVRENYRMDDTEGCLDTVHSIAVAAIEKAEAKS